MTELSIRFTSDEKDENPPIKVSLFRPQEGTMTDPVPFEPPLEDAELSDLRWYLELFSTWPTGPDYERAERIEAQLEDWGRALLESVTSDRESAQLWRQFADAPADTKLLTIDATNPRALRLPWELLADEGGHIFAQGIGVRRRLQKTTSAVVKPFSLPVRVLVVVSRPDDAGFIDPRVETIALLDALDRLGGRAEVEFLYPPTLKTLTDRLRSKTLPPVHVVHFDGHGVYDAALGLGYLLFENDKHKSDRVDANRLGTLLNRCGVPLMVLNACQSAKQEEANPYASVAARLIRAGVGSVLAMNYSVLVVAARKFVEAFYGGLVNGLTVGQAVDEGRYALLADEERHTITRRDKDDKLVEVTIKLRDWFLPALYQQAADPVVFKSPLEGGQGGVIPLPGGVRGGFPLSLTDPSSPGGLPPEPRHGFHGRAREMLQLERALAEHEIVILHGFGGMGKTALATEAGRWFYRTGRFPGGAAFVSFEHGGSLSQLCSWVGQAVSGDPNFVLGEGDPVERVAALLSERPALVILDNFESVLGREPLMPPEELKAVLDAVWKWATSPPLKGDLGGCSDVVDTPLPPLKGGKHSPTPLKGEQHPPAPLKGGLRPKILITTRDTAFNDARFGPSKHCAQIELGGLARRDALELAAAVLDDYGINRTNIGRQDLVDLMERLGGHPLSLYLVLPQLKDNTPAELSDQFEQLLPGFITGAAKERNESLTVSLEFSLRRLGEETRAALPALAVFEGGAMESDLLAITEIDPELWKVARTELEQAALVSVESLPNITAPFLRFHPTLVPYLSTQLPVERRAVLEERYRERYYKAANYLYHSDTQHPHEARAIALREMPNLKRAFELTVAAATEETHPSPPSTGSGQALPGGELGDRGGATHPQSLPGGELEEERAQAAATAVDFANSIVSFLDAFGRWRERETLLACLADLQVTSDKGLTQAEYLMLSQRGEVLRQQGRAAEAEQVFLELLTKMEAGAAYNAAYDHAMMLLSLGRCLAAQGQPAQAIEYHRRALQEFEDLSESSQSAKGMLGTTYIFLGIDLMNVGQLDKAKQVFDTGLEIYKEIDDYRNIAVTLSRLGELALRRGDLQEAARRYTEALKTFRTLGEPRHEAIYLYQLGVVAQKAEDWDEAERCYRESLKLSESFNDLPGVARTCNQLAMVAEGASRLDDAERWYLRAIEIDEKLGNPKELGRDYSNLAGLYLSQNRLDEAELYARRALEIIERLDLSAEPWIIYNILAKIAGARGRTAEVTQWRRKAQDSYATYAGSMHEIRQFLPIFQVVIDACKGNAQMVEQANVLLQQLEEGLPEMAAAVHRILDGERDIEVLREGLPAKAYVIVRALLAQLAGETPSYEAGSAAPKTEEPQAKEEEGVSLQDFLALIVQACRPDAPPGLAEQLHASTRAMSADPNTPTELRALFSVLNQILSGERAPDLAALPPELADLVQGILGEL